MDSGTKKMSPGGYTEHETKIWTELVRLGCLERGRDGKRSGQGRPWVIRNAAHVSRAWGPKPGVRGGGWGQVAGVVCSVIPAFGVGSPPSAAVSSSSDRVGGFAGEPSGCSLAQRNVCGGVTGALVWMVEVETVGGWVGTYLGGGTGRTQQPPGYQCRDRGELLPRAWMTSPWRDPSLGGALSVSWEDTGAVTSLAWDPRRLG